jgi:hypothetical protein
MGCVSTMTWLRAELCSRGMGKIFFSSVLYPDQLWGGPKNLLVNGCQGVKQTVHEADQFCSVPLTVC